MVADKTFHLRQDDYDEDLDAHEPMIAKEHFHELIDELTERDAEVALLILERRRAAAPELDPDDSGPTNHPRAARWSARSENLR
jgi:hypothetical protein